MDIEAFYDADPRRRAQPEVSFGTDFVDAYGRRWRVAWIPSTGEIYAMWEAELQRTVTDLVIDRQLTVYVLAVIADEFQVRWILEGHEQHHGTPGGLEWVVEQFARAGHPPPW